MHILNVNVDDLILQRSDIELPHQRSPKTEFITLQDDCFRTIRLFKYLANSNRISTASPRPDVNLRFARDWFYRLH